MFRVHALEVYAGGWPHPKSEKCLLTRLPALRRHAQGLVQRLHPRSQPCEHACLPPVPRPCRHPNVVQFIGGCTSPPAVVTGGRQAGGARGRVASPAWSMPIWLAILRTPGFSTPTLPPATAAEFCSRGSLLGECPGSSRPGRGPSGRVACWLCCVGLRAPKISALHPGLCAGPQALVPSLSQLLLCRRAAASPGIPAGGRSANMGSTPLDGTRCCKGAVQGCSDWAAGWQFRARCDGPSLEASTVYAGGPRLIGPVPRCTPLRSTRCPAAAPASQGMLYLHAHSPPIIHRDLKSPNLLVDSAWRVKVGARQGAGTAGAGRRGQGARDAEGCQVLPAP